MSLKNYIMFILIASVSLLLTLNFVKNESKGPVLQCKPAERDFLSREYDVAVKEIELRIQEEHDLFIQKIIFVGAVLGSVFFTKVVSRRNELATTPIMVVCCWAAVAVAAIVDVRIMFNNIIIGDRGTWIRAVENVFLTGTNSPGWENYFHSQSILFRSPQSAFVFADRQLLTSALFILALFLSFSFSEQHRSGHFKLFKAAAIGCLVLIAWPGMYQQFNLMHFCLLMLGTIFVIFWKPPAQELAT